MQTVLNERMFTINIAFYVVFVISEIVFFLAFNTGVNSGFVIS